MASIIEAQNHIQRLRSELDPAHHPRFASLLTNALDLVVSQLYDRSTHFIHEILQNVDDTTYKDSVIPTVSFTYHAPGRLRIDSNQLGFDAKDIDAICSLGSSTKENQRESVYSIGEKGIGFKSVFRVANTIWLSSQNYSIRWDRAAELGAMVPEWATFPEPLQDGRTSLLFDLTQDEQLKQIVDDLKVLDASLLMFLNKIRRVDIDVFGSDGQHWKKSVTRAEMKSGDSSTIIIHDGKEEYSYFKSGFITTNLPEEPRRRGKATSELLLVFPLQQESKEVPSTSIHNVFSGLPIGNYGLKALPGFTMQSDRQMQFLLNADFVLTASRQTIDVSLPWNLAIRDSLTPALLKAFDLLRDTSSRYTWPWYTTVTSPSAFFEPALKTARRSIALMQSLESFDGISRLPKDLIYVDREAFAGDDGLPMTLDPNTKSRYLSLKYPPWSIESIIDLGVGRLTNAEFLCDLYRMIADDPSTFQTRSSRWHEDLAALLLPLVDSPELEQSIRQLNLVPLLHGTWTNLEVPKGRRLQRVPSPVFWPSDIDLHGSEDKLPFSVVQLQYSENPNRCKLFERLGVETLDIQRICRGIVTAHATKGFGSFEAAAAISSLALISHAMLLYRASWAPKFGPDPSFWFVSEDGHRHRGSDLYTTAVAEDSTDGISVILKEMSPRLHLGYLEPGTLSHASTEDHPNRCVTSLRRDFLSYLSSTFRVSSVPRLVEKHAGSPCKFSLSGDFRNLFQKYPSSDIFQLILDKWECYSPWIELDELHRSCEECLSSRAILLNDIRESPSRIEHGTHTKVMDTVLPDIDPLIQDGEVDTPVLKISSVKDEIVRNRLHCLGVNTRKSCRFYMACLKAMRRQMWPSQEGLAYLYEHIQSYWEDDNDEIEHAILEERLIYLSCTDPENKQPFCGWTTISHCVKMGVLLENVYPRSAQLFQMLQAADGLGLHNLIRRLISLADNPSDVPNSSFIQCLSQLNKAISAMSRISATKRLESLRAKPVFPIIQVNSSSITELRSSENKDWFIADRAHLRHSFMGKVALLDIPAGQANQMGGLFSCLGLQLRRLSICVATRTDPTGSIKLRALDTGILQSRAMFFESLTPKTNPRKCTIARHIRETTVSTAVDIVDTHQLNMDGGVILNGRNTSSQAVCRMENGQLKLFVSAKSSSAVPLIYLAEYLIDFCEIENPSHIRLLYILLTEPDDNEVEDAFVKLGVHVEVPTELREEDSSFAEDAFWKYASAMDLPNLSDFRTSSTEKPLSEFTAQDLLQGFHGDEQYRQKGDSAKSESDRRLYLMRHLREEGVLEDEMMNGAMGTESGIDPNSNMKFLGETFTSSFFQRELGDSYDPVQCWTSPLRTRAGLPAFITNEENSPFTISDRQTAERVTDLLEKRGWKSITRFKATPPTYHFDIGVSAGGINETFEWTTSQLLLAHRNRLLVGVNHDLQSNVVVLIRIVGLYTAPKFCFILDPWLHFSSGILHLEPGSVLRASLRSTQRARNEESIASPDQLGAATSSAASMGAKANIVPATALSRDIANVCSQSERVPDEPGSPGKQSPTHMPATSDPSPGLPISSTAIKRKRSSEQFPSAPETCPPGNKIARRLDIVPWREYKYTDLHENEIRLFTLFPGNTFGSVRGMLWATDIKTAGVYTTLSYVWGPEHQTKHLLKTPSGGLSILESLHTALVSIRSNREPMTLWIDALCINQQDKQEKLRQINLLPEIFQTSFSTLAFIGGGEDHSQAVQMLAQVRARMVLGPWSQEWPDDLPNCSTSWEERGMPSPEDSIWTSVAHFFKNPWFRRAWIVQEAVIARRLHLVHRNISIDWNHLFLVMEHVEKGLETTEKDMCDSWTPFLKLAKLRHMEDRSGRVSILKLLENFRHTKASDPRDKYFSLLGIASDGNLQEFEPDYSSTLGEITHKFAAALFRRFSKNKQAMMLLYRAGLSQSIDLPSWVPDWLEEKPNGLHDVLGRGNAFDACGDLVEQIEYVPDRGELEVEAYFVDEIDHVTKSYNGAEMPEQRRYFAEIKECLDEFFGDTWDNEKIQRVLWEAPVAGAKHPKFAAPGDLSIHGSWQAYMRLLNLDDPDKESEMQKSQEEHDLETKSRVYRSLLADEILNWRFFVLHEWNLCGIAPYIVQEGDLIHLFHGGVVPFVTRRSEKRDGAYQLIGQCYVWGMMQGEGISYAEMEQETVRLH